MTRGYRGFVLAAGLGTRLRPLTLSYPKPLIPFLGTTALELALWRLHQAGIAAVAVNAHYLADMIASALHRNPFDQRLHLSVEKELLGTGGAFVPLAGWRGQDHLVVLNGDIVSTIDLQAAIAVHENTAAIATMVLLPDVIPGESGVYHQAGQVHAIGRQGPAGMQQGNYACVQILSPQFLDLLPASGVFDVISKGYQVALDQGLRVSCLVHKGYWHDLRTPQYFAEAVRDGLTYLGAQGESIGIAACRQARGLVTVLGSSGQVLYDQSCQLGRGVVLDGVVVLEPGVALGDGARLSASIVLPGTQVAAHAVVENKIIGPHLSVPLDAGDQ